MKRRGVVVARHRREIVIEDDQGEVRTGLVRGRTIKPLAGDEIAWHEHADGTTVIEHVLPRRTLLERIDSRGRPEGIAANVSALLVVVAASPAPDWQLVDRYLVAAELIGIDAILLSNKQDLDDHTLGQRTAVYAQLGYEVIATSVVARRGLDRLAEVLHGQRGVLVGQSGVGKSSLLNALIDSEMQATAQLSHRRALGRHTTTASVLYRLPGGGELIDSPGVRRYAPWIGNPADLEQGFREIRRYLGQCRFSDCRHFDEPGCAVRSAVVHGDIDRERYLSYRGLRATIEKLGSR